MGVLVAEITLAVLVLAAVIGVLAVYARRRYLAHGADALVCGFRVDPRTRWRLGLLRMADASLQVFPLFGWTILPAYTLTRHGLQVSASSQLDDAAGLGVVLEHDGRRPRLVSTTGVTGEGRRVEIELALGATQYTTLRYWVESAPPAQRMY